MKPTRAIPVCVCLAAGLAAAQQAPPALMVNLGEKSQPLPLAKVDTHVRVLGYLAETRTTMTFANPHGRALAGELYFPLPEGATVSGYALDIQGKLVDGVVVEKPKAREVFEKIVRQGVDPGLVEWVAGNNFRTRVFPIPAGGTRTVRVDHVTDLLHTKDGFAVHLPLKHRGKVGQFRLRVEVVQGQAEPVVREGGLANFKFDRWEKGYAAEVAMADAALERDLIVVLPDVSTRPVQVEKAPDGEHYFCINDFPAPPPEGPVARPETPKLVTVLWDASGSRAGDHKREIELLTKCLNYLACGQAQPTTKFAGFDVDLVLFRNAAGPARRFRWRNLNALDGRPWNPDLLAALASVDYDGGTQTAAIGPPRDAEKPDFYLLFTDGLSNFGREDPTDFDRPVYVFSADATANHPFLRYLAMKTGGQYFNLNRLEDEAVVNRLARPPYALLDVWSAGAKVEEAYPRVGTPTEGRFSLVARLAGAEAKVTLGYGRAGKVTERREFTVKQSDAVEGTILQRAWAQRKVDDLSMLPKRNTQAIAEVGRKYSIVTPGTSLLVLEGLEQYLEHRIPPPKSLPEMHAEYWRRMDTVEMQQKKQRADKIEKVLALWRGRVTWWETQFKYAKDFKYVEKKGEGGGAVAGEDRGEGREDGPAPSPPAPPSPMVVPSLTPSEGAPATPAPATGEHGRMVGTPRPLADGIPDPEHLRSDKPGGERVAQPGVLIKAWDPKTPYLAALKAAPEAQRFAVYMEQRKSFGGGPAFFLDCAEFFREAGNEMLAVQVLSNVAELELESAALVRVLAHRLAQWGYLDLAAGLFEKALELRPEEPQSYRDLALVLARQEQYRRAVELLNEVVMKHWDDRFAEVETIALMELNRLLPKARGAGVDLEKLGVDGRLVQPLDVDVRIVLTWDADMTDIDLWVVEPSGEKAFYGHRATTIGGHFSRDFTGGYGPEEYCLRKAMNGVHKIQVNYYGTSAAKLLGSVTLQVDIFTNFGRPNEQHKSITRRLRTAKETIQVGEIEF